MSRKPAATARAAALPTTHHRLLLAFAAALALLAAIPTLGHAAPAPARATSSWTSTGAMANAVMATTQPVEPGPGKRDIAQRRRSDDAAGAQED